MAAKPGGGVVWLIECKDPTEPYSPSELKRAWDRFHETRGWIAKLENKLRDLKVNPVAVAAKVGAAPTAAIVSVMVTRHPTVAAYSESPNAKFAGGLSPRRVK